MQYQGGLGNHLSTEARPGAVPQGQNSPQRAPLGLYAEQLSGTAFTAPRGQNQRTWLYRIRPSTIHGKFRAASAGQWVTAPGDGTRPPPDQLRWDPMPLPTKPTAWPNGVVTYAVNGDAANRTGVAVHLYALTQSMENEYFYDSDGELMFVPQEGALLLKTEMGHLEVAPGEIAVIPRGIKFQVVLKSGSARGYVGENYGQPFRLPELGPIGANGLANARDFLAPTAAFEDRTGSFLVWNKFEGVLWSAPWEHVPLDVVGWHGNYYPYKYDLALFNTIGTVSYDHPDPSLFTVLTSPSEQPGTANCDFVIFPPRWMVAEKTFRPPYFHRNVMSEFMGLVKGVYDAKGDGFAPGGGSLHNCMTGHGPDAETFEKASAAELKPQYQGDTMAFMFESRLVFRPTAAALEMPLLQKDYLACWKGLKKHFKN